MWFNFLKEIPPIKFLLKTGVIIKFPVDFIFNLFKKGGKTIKKNK